MSHPNKVETVERGGPFVTIKSFMTLGQTTKNIFFRETTTSLKRFFLLSRRSESKWWNKTAEDLIHPVPDPGAGERVPLQPIPDQTEENRNCSRALPHRAANQDLVPEPPDEVEEGAQDGFNERHADAPDASGVGLPAPCSHDGHAPVRGPAPHGLRTHAPRRQGPVWPIQSASVKKEITNIFWLKKTLCLKISTSPFRRKTYKRTKLDFWATFLK